MTAAAGYQILSVVSDRSPGWEHPAQAKLASFANLPTGWHFGSGVAPSTPVLDQADRILSIGISLGLVADVFPGANNDVAVAFYNGDECVEVIVDSDTSMELFVERRTPAASHTLHHEANVGLKQLYRGLRNWQPGTAWSSLDSSILGISISSISGLQTSPLSRVLESSSVPPMEKRAYRS